MAQYDGAIRIATKITTKDAEESLASLEHQIKKSAKYMDELRSKMDTLKGQKIPTKEYEKLENELLETLNRIEQLRQSQAGLSKSLMGLSIEQLQAKAHKLQEEFDSTTDELEHMGAALSDLDRKKLDIKATEPEADLSSLEDEYNALTTQYEELQDKNSQILGQITNINNAIKFSEEIDKAEISASKLEQKLQSLENSGKAFKLGEETAEYKGYERQLEYEEEAVKKAKEHYEQLLLQTPEMQKQAAEEQRLAQIRDSAVVGNQRIVQSVERIKQLEQEIADLKKVNRTEGYEDYDNRVRELSSLKRQVKDYNANIKQTQKSYSRLGQVAKKAFSVATSAISRLNKSAKKSGGLFSNIASRFKGLALSLLIFNQISKAFNSMISGMREGFKNLYNEVDSFKSTVDSIKASSLTLQNSFAAAFRPLVEIAIPYIQKTIDAIASLMDTIGQLTAAITGQKTYTKAIKQTTAAIKDQNKAQNRQLSSLDKLNNLTSNKGNDADSGAGVMFEEDVLIPKKSLDIAEWIKGMWEKSDFTELGKSLGERVKNGLDNINWEEIKEKGQNAAKSLATLINGFIKTEGLPESIGKTIGNAINTGVSTVKTFFEETEFDELGKSLAKTANAAMETTDWKELAETISLGIESVLDMAIGFLDEFDWEEFTESMEEFLAGIDWGGIFGRLGLLLLELLRGAFTIGNKLGTDMTKSLADFFRGIGWDSVAGFFDGLSENIKKHGERVKLMFQYVIDWAKEKLGIHSPSTVFSDIGKNLVQGLMNGLAGLKEKVLKIFNSVKNAVKTPINMILGFVESLANGIIKAINFAIGALNNLSITVPDWLKYVPGLSDIAGKKFGFNIPELEQVSIPRLATGTVVPPNREFMAVLGDNKREPEVVSPLSTIEQAVENVLRRSGGIENDKEINLHLTVECEGYQLIHIMQKLNKEYAKQNGGKSILA